jgi:Bacterial SH3 domain/T5orf172 domain
MDTYFESECYSNPGYVYFLNASSTNRYKIDMAKCGRLKARTQELNRQQAAYPIDVIGWIEVSDCKGAESFLHDHFAQYRQNGEWFEFEEDVEEEEIYRAYGETMAIYWIDEDLSDSEDMPSTVDGYDFFDSVNLHCKHYLGIDDSQTDFEPDDPLYETTYLERDSYENDSIPIGWIFGIFIVISAVFFGISKIIVSGIPSLDSGRSRIEYINLLPDDGIFSPNHRIDASVIGKGGANIRSGPQTTYPEIGDALPNNSPIKTLKRSQNGWFLVQTESGLKGWVAGNLIQ